MAEPQVAAILLAAGYGERFGTEVQKQFADLAGLPVAAHSLMALEQCPQVSWIIAVVPQDRPSWVTDSLNVPKLVSMVEGSDTRQASLAEGTIALPQEASMVVVHDAVRPLASPNLITSVIQAVKAPYQGAITSIDAEDALKEVEASGEVVGSVDRSVLRRAQTPQAFDREALVEALAVSDAEGFVADDCSELVMRAGGRVAVVDGSRWNIKVTRPEDLGLCEAILSARRSAESLRSI